MASTTTGGTTYEGGAGGKFRKRPFIRSRTTPYDRPSSALPNPRKNGWLPKLVDPASKLVFASARMFFSSLFRKRLPPPLPPPPPEANRESRDGLQDTVPNFSAKYRPGVQGPAIDEEGNTAGSFNCSETFELEQILKQKKFTRSEVDRLTELLRSKTVDIPSGYEEKRSESNVRKPVSALEIQDEFAVSPAVENRTETNLERQRFHGVRAFERQDEFASSPILENKVETDLVSQRFHGGIPHPILSSRVLEDDVPSPAQLAKTYMGSRFLKVSPSTSGLRSKAVREDANLLNNVPFPPKSPAMSLAVKPAVRVGVPEIGNMARTPYSMVNSSSIQKGIGSTYDGYGGPSASASACPYVWENERFGTERSALKRRSAVLEDDFESLGPIRRLRQKTSFSTPKNLSSQVSGGLVPSHKTGVGSDAARPSLSSMQKLHRTSKTLVENADSDIPSTSYNPVPSKSSEMATRILQQLDKLVPKEKSSWDKVVAREKSTCNLSPNVLRGQALRSLEDVDSSKIVQIAHDSHKLEDLCNTFLPNARDDTSHKQDNVEGNGPQRSLISCEILAPSVKDTVSGVKTADLVISPSQTQPPLKKQTFRMSANEHFPEPEEIKCNEAAPTPLAEGRKKLEASMVESNVASTEAVMLNKTPMLSEISAASPVVNESSGLGTTDTSVSGEQNMGFTLPSTPAPSATCQPVKSTPQSTLAFDKSIPLEDPNAPPMFATRSETDEAPFLTFPFNPREKRSFGLKSSAPPESNQESPNSLAIVGSVEANTVAKVPELDKGDIENAQKSGDTRGKLESPAVSTSIPATRNFTFVAPAKNSSNGLPASSPSMNSFPASDLTSSHFTNQTSTNGFTNVASSTTDTMPTNGTTTAPTISNSIVSTSAAAPSFLASPVFKSGSSTAAPSNSVPTASTTSSAETTGLNAKTEKETANFGQFASSVSSSVFGTSGTQSVASSIPLFRSSTSSSSALTPVTNSVNSSGGFSWQQTTSSMFNTTFNSGSPSTGFSLGTSSGTYSSPMVFGSSTGASSGSIYAFGSAAFQTQPLGSTVSVTKAFSGNGDQMNMEDGMAEDTVPASTPAVPVYSQLPTSAPPSAFVFAPTVPSAGQVSQFSSQQSQSAAQNSSPFQTSGGSFSVGSGGGEKSNRKILRVKRSTNRKR